MNDIKPLIQSKTFWSVVVMLIAAIAPEYNLVSADDFTVTANTVVEVVAAVTALVSRYRARDAIQGFVHARNGR